MGFSLPFEPLEPRDALEERAARGRVRGKEGNGAFRDVSVMERNLNNDGNGDVGLVSLRVCLLATCTGWCNCLEIGLGGWGRRESGGKRRAFASAVRRDSESGRCM